MCKPVRYGRIKKLFKKTSKAARKKRINMKRYAVFVFGILAILFISGCTQISETLNANETLENELQAAKEMVHEYSQMLNRKILEYQALEAQLNYCQSNYTQLADSYDDLVSRWNNLSSACSEFFETNRYVESSYDGGHRFFTDSEIHWLPVSCESRSMEPTIYCEDIVLGFVPENEDEINVGDIIVYENYLGEHIIHRVVGKTMEGKFSLRGDNNDYPDTVFVPFEDVKYKVISIVYNHTYK